LDQHSIIQGCKKGQEKAFKALVDQYAPKLMAVCMRYLNDADLAKDALQESLISVFKSIATYNGSGSFDGWLTKITVRACLSELRKKKHLHDLTIVDQQEIKAYEDHQSFDMDDIIKLINELPDLQRIVFNMNIVEGYSHAEIGTLLNIAESSSRVYLARARKWLQESIESSERRQQILKTKLTR